MPRSGKERRATVTEHIEVTGQQPHRPVPDAVADQPVDTPVGHATRAKKLISQLGELNLKPSDIALVAISHTHGDHVGNVDLFPDPTLLIQKAEVDWAFADGKPAPFKKDQARWSPGVNVGKPIELSDTCVLIKHREQWLLWDTGYPFAEL
jgi:glyoxylase-like metal-dependent hydrolase (beta-lactamase superfamily II)